MKDVRKTVERAELEVRSIQYQKLDKKTNEHVKPRPRVHARWDKLRHQLVLIGTWLGGPLIGARFIQRFRGASWRLQRPSRFLGRSSCEIHLSGQFADASGRPAAQIIVRLGRRLVFALAKASDDGDLHPFHISFQTKPGFKFVSLLAQLHNGKIITLGYRLLYCSAQVPLPHQPKTDLISDNVLITPSEIELKPTLTPLVSIIIPVYNQTGYTLRCLKAIGLHTGAIPIEVILIDDCSPEPEISLLNDVPNLRVHRNKTNQGFLLNCNEGAKIAHGKYLLFLNNDTQVQAGWLQALLDVFELKPDAGLVGAKLIYPDGLLQEAGGIVWQDGSANNYGHRKNPGSPAFNYLKEVDYCSGACVAIEADFFTSLGGFDPRYAPAYYEDTDLAFQVRAAGRRVYYQPRCEVVHYEGRSHGTSTDTGVKRYQVINQAKFLERWKDVLSREQLPDQEFFQARDRSARRPSLLVIDHYVPQPDQDAGSRCIAHLLDFFVAQGFNVKFFPDNLAYNSIYTPALEARGIEVLDQRFGSDFSLAAWLQDHGRQLDYVMLSRAHISVKHLDLLELHSHARRLFYGHDLLSRTLNRSHALTSEPHLLTQAKQWEQWEQAVFPRVHAAYYPSNEEIIELCKTNPGLRARLVPLLTFPPSTAPLPQAEDFAERNSLLFVGGFGHPPNRDAIRWFLATVWPAVTARLPNAVLNIVGSNPPEDLLTLSLPGVRMRGFVSDDELALFYSRARIAIAPLRQGGGVKGKILEALNRNVPVVTTPIGAEGIPDAETAMAIAEPAEFAETLIALFQAPVRLAGQVAEGRRLLAKYFSEDTLRNAFKEDIPHLDNKRLT